MAFRDFWGAEKRAALAEDAGVNAKALAKRYSALNPEPTIGLPYLATDFGLGYTAWPRLTEMLPEFYPGVQTKRDEFLVDIERDLLEVRVLEYFSPRVDDQAISSKYPEVFQATARYDPRAVRKQLIARGPIRENLVRFAYRPMDTRWVYWEPETKLLGEKSPALFPAAFEGNVFLCSQQRPRGDWDPPQVASVLGCLDLMDRSASFFPMYVKEEAMAGSIFEGAPAGTRTNLSSKARTYLDTMGSAREVALFSHIIATLHTPKYRSENAGGLRQDWPRIPLPREHKVLDRSVELGWELRGLLDPEVTPQAPLSGYARDFKEIAVLTGAQGSQLDPAKGDLALTAGWGHGGNGRPTMPGQGKVVDRGGHLDVYLNDRAYWANVPKPVWEYTLGGYQVIKKWLSYREKTVLGRDLAVEEARYVTEMVRRIAAILALGPRLDENYEAVKRDPYQWPKS